MSNLAVLKKDITNMEAQFKAALPEHVTVKKFTRVLLTAISSTPDLQDANKTTLFASCMSLAQQGLMPDGKEAAIVTFKSKKTGVVSAQAMPMVAGILKLIRNSGELASLSPHTVYKNDTFDYWIDENGEHLTHRPLLDGDRGDFTHAYCMAKTKDGAVYIEVMSKSELDKVRNSSRAKDFGPWKTWYGEMAKKTVIRRLAKRLPMSTDLDMAIKADDDLYESEATQADDTPPPVPTDVTPTKPKKLAEVIEAQAEEAESPAAVQLQNEPQPPQMDEHEELPI